MNSSRILKVKKAPDPEFETLDLANQLPPALDHITSKYVTVDIYFYLLYVKCVCILFVLPTF
jgi:hypothetical protein